VLAIRRPGLLNPPVGTDSTAKRTGLRLWLPVAGAALAVGLSYLAIFSVPPLITVFVDDLGLSHAEAGALMSVCLAGFLVGSVLSGRLANRFGPAPVMVSGLVLCGVATLCFAFTTSLPVFLACRLVVGLGGGLIYAPGVTLVTSLLPPAKANVGVGIFLSGLSVGGTVAFFATPLLEEGLDWRWPSWIFGAAVLAGAPAVLALSGSASRGLGRAAAAVGGYRAVLANRTFRLLCAGLFVALFVAYGVFTWIPPYLDEAAGFSTAQISLTSMSMTLAGIPATFGIGWLADRTGRPLSVAGTALALPLTLAVLALASGISFAGATVVAVLSALGISGGLGPLYALPPAIVGAAAAATASGLAAAAAMAGGITSTYLGGYLVGATDGYGLAFGIYTVAAGLAALLFVPLIARSVRRAGRAGPAPTARAR